MKMELNKSYDAVLLGTRRVSLREWPLPGSEVIAMLEPASHVTAYETRNGYTRITAGDLVGYVSADLCDKIPVKE